MKHTIRSFSVGLLTAGLIMLAVFYFLEEGNNDQVTMPTEEMISHIEQDGFRVLTEKEYIAFSVTNAQEDDDTETKETSSEEEENATEVNEESEAKETEEENNSNEAEEESTPVTKTINIENGMASSHISSMLEDENLVDDAEAFNSYLQDNDYSLKVQLGQHELTEGMTYYEIAKVLTN